MSEAQQWTCGAAGPSPFPDAAGYRCSLDVGHEGAHEAWVPHALRPHASQFLDSWPRTPDLIAELDDGRQAAHDRARREDPDHDQVSCVCCCFDCDE